MKKIRFLLFALICVLVLPITLVNASSAPTGLGQFFFANGTPVTITATVPENGTLETLAGFTATGSAAYISWADGETTRYVATSSGVQVFGGSRSTAEPVTVVSTSITMTGGEVYRIYGGNLGADNTVVGTTLQDASSVTGNVTINVTGGTIGSDIYGGGRFNTAVAGTVSISIAGAHLKEWVYVGGGVHGNGKEGYNDYEHSRIMSNAVVNNVEIYYNNNTTDGNVNIFAGPSGGNTIVNSSTLTMGDGGEAQDTIVGYIFAGGVNGNTTDATVILKSDVKVTNDLSITNRGYIGDADIQINGAYVENLYTGAGKGCFESDGNISSAVTGNVTISIQGTNNVKHGIVSPQIVKTNSGYNISLGNVSVTNADTAQSTVFTLKEFDTGNATPGRAIATYGIYSSQTVHFGSNTEMKVNANVSLTNEGVLELDGSYSSNGTLVNTGSLDLTGTASNNGEINNTTGTINISGTLNNDRLGTLTNTGNINTTPTGSYVSTGTATGDIAKVIQSGNEGTYAGEETGLTITGVGNLGGENADFTEGEGEVRVDGNVVDPSNYTLASGSVIVNLKKSYLDTLPAGEHVFRLVYDNGSYAEATFTSTVNPENPQTFDNIMLYISIAVVSMGAITTIMYFNKKKSYS